MQNDDERKIRDLLTTWMAASRAGDVQTVLSLIADDAVFLVPGGVVMHKADFAAQAAPGGPHIDGSSEIEELRVLGDWAFMRTRLRVVVTPPGGQPAVRAGHTLTILRKEHGKWVLARDANLLAPAPQ
ncbi:MAG TPA: SgcJ/EcaC family oxidoreductase [Albitalea sp.]|nr:SgcJ/EcaC family oxidoreductase [Albitalea sp.]